MTAENSFTPYKGINDKLRLERIRRNVLNCISDNEKQVKIIDRLMAAYPFETNMIARQKNYLLAIQLYRKDLINIAELISKIA